MRGATARSPRRPSACPTPSTSSSGTVRGIDVASEAVEASRTGASERATRSATSDAQLLDLDRAGRHLRVGRPQHAGERGARLPGRQHHRRLAGDLGLGLGEPHDADPGVGAVLEEVGEGGRVGVEPAVEDGEDPRPASGGSRSRSGTDMRNSATSSSRATSSSAAVVVVATWSPGSGDVTERRWGSHFIHVRQRRLGGHGGGDREVLRAVQAGRLDDQRRGDAVDERRRAVDAEHADLGEVDGDRDAGDLGAALGSRLGLLAEVVVAAALERRLDERRRRAQPDAQAQEVRARRDHGPTGRSCAARPGGRGRRGRARRGGARCAPRRRVAPARPAGRRATPGTSPGRAGSGAARSGGPRSSWRRGPAATSASGRGTASCSVKANSVTPAPSGASTLSTWKRRGSGRVGIRPSSLAVRSVMTGGRYGVRWNSIWPSWS